LPLGTVGGGGVSDTLRGRLTSKLMDELGATLLYGDTYLVETKASHAEFREIVDAILTEMRTPTTEVILAGIETHDSVQWFWPLMIDRLRGVK
jgi:EAL domain-containing protein (putative c-di-GMP-specific phosphodiesterase class I)